MKKCEVFEEEISYINDDKYKESLKKMIELLPDYFFEIPASSTGKYHPSFALGDGGLVRHTKVAVRIGYELLNNDSIGNVFKPFEKDLMLMSLLIHDGLKSGITKEKYTRVDHPLLISNYVKENKEQVGLSDDEVDFICNCVESHMGQWNKDFNGNEVLPLPKNKYQKFVHMCDYLSSKKFLDVKFDNDNKIQ